MDEAVVATHRAMPHNVRGPTVKLGEDLAQAPFAAGIAPAGNIRVPIALWQRSALAFVRLPAVQFGSVL